LSLPQSETPSPNRVPEETALAALPETSPTKKAPKVNDDAVKCPLCGGFTHIEKTDLRDDLKNPRLREQVELYIAQLLKSPVEELTSVGATQAGHDFQKDVHNWNPSVPMWKRSPKE
jgi:hypothetical protein